MNQIQDKVLSAEEQKRMDTLRLQKEFERKECERQMWRLASSPPRIAGSELPQPGKAIQPKSPELTKATGGLFTKLKLGRFLG